MIQNDFFARLGALIFGLLLYAFGIVITIKANVGLAPWDVFHWGLSMQTGISIGTASVYTGLVICLAIFFLKEKMGLGTILNMLLIGVFIDIIIWFNFIPKMSSYYTGVPFLILGIYIIAFGSYYYMRSGFGAGPRDSLMVAINRHSSFSIGTARVIIEGLVIFLGYLLGGLVGLGTVLAGLGVGFAVQQVFKWMKFDVKAVQHENLADTWEKWKDKEKFELKNK